MKLAIPLAGLIFLVSTASFAAKGWSGYLVDSNCYESVFTNTKGSTTVNRDMDGNTKLCAPSAKTKSFGVVELDWKIVKFDAAGNAKAVEFVQGTDLRDMYRVSIAGEMNGEILKVDSISFVQETAANKSNE
jgi:hypothetical protein